MPEALPPGPAPQDYHVLVLARPTEGPSWVLDLDCTLEPFPCTLQQYRQQALLGAGGGLPVQYRRCATWGTPRGLAAFGTCFGWQSRRASSLLPTRHV